MSKLITVHCKYPLCKNTFCLHQSAMNRKLYCSRECRSKHHWMITPLFEKKCENPSCFQIIKRKFKQQINKVHYCSPSCRKSYIEQILKKNRNDTIKSNCQSCQIEIVTKREPCGKLVPKKLCSSCLSNANRKKALRMSRLVNNKYKNDPIFKKRRKKIYRNTGLKMRHRYKTDGLPERWINWYRKFSSIGKSKIENTVADVIKPKVSRVERYYPISNIFVDIYIPEKNLVIECLGDYWHMNPSKYSAMDYNKSTKRTAMEQWEKDKNRRLFLENLGYSVVELWESEINQGNYKKLDIYI